MPNWCENSLTITGPKNVINEFVLRAKINNPPRYKEKPGFINDISDDEQEEENELLNFNSLYPVPQNILNQGYSMAGYNWEIKNWGCKWGACDTQFMQISDTKVVYNFESAWNPPIPFLIKVSKNFSELKFNLKYKEPGMGFSGKAVIENGKIIDEIFKQ